MWLTMYSLASRSMALLVRRILQSSLKSLLILIGSVMNKQ